MKYILFLLLIIASCKNKIGEVRDGGSCDYKERAVPAKLIRLEISMDSSIYDAFFEIDKTESQNPPAKDTIQYTRVNNNSILAETVVKDKIDTGKVYQYVEMNIISGSCTPHMWYIKLEEYTAAQK